MNLFNKAVCVTGIAAISGFLIQADQQAKQRTQDVVIPVEVTKRDLKLAGQVQDISKFRRTITLKTSEGNMVNLRVKAGQDLPEFDEIKVGDKIVAQYTQSLAIEIQHA